MAAAAKMVASMDAANGLVLDENELEIAVKVMLQLSSNPELGHFSFLPPDSKGRKLRRALRIAALKWLKPGAADNMKDIQAQARDSDRVTIQQCGIRLARNQRKRALPAQHGHIMLDGEAPAGTPMLLPPLQDKPPEVAPRANKSEARVIVNSDATSAPPAALPAPVAATATTAAPTTPSAATTTAAPTEASSTAATSTPAVAAAATATAAPSTEASVPLTTAAALDQSQLPTGRRPREPAQARVKTKRQDSRVARDAERKAKREASNAVGIDVEDIREAMKSSDSKRAAGIDITDGGDDDNDDDITSASTPKDSKEPAAAAAGPSFSKTPEAMPAREPTESISSSSSREDFKEPAAGRPTKRKEKVYLRTPQPCYVCKKHYTLLHHFYDRMCPSCADFNYDKRFQTTDLTLPPLPTSPGTPPQPVRRRIALITGGRIKIGFECVLMLVRAGAFVIVTSRFPKDTAMRFAQEPDYNEWRDRIHIYGLDLRVLADVEAFCEHILATYPRLDMLINNAAQTIRRPPQYYEHMMTLEGTPVAQLAAPLAATLHEFREPVQLRLTATAESKVHAIADSTGSAASESKTHEPSKDLLDAKEADIRLAPTSAIAVRSAQGMSSAELSQVPLLPEDHVRDEVNFPVKCFDNDGQQIDKRSSQTWVKQLHEVSTVELAEVHIVNALAPFVLNSKLKPLLMKSKDGAFIINVSSMEGKFRAFKDVTHPHTNMAKAALNMMTHTVAKDLAHDRIFINSVDTGWVTEELPFPIAQQKKREGFEPPLDEIDGAARILDPIWRSIRDGVHDFGMFFKDYRPADW